ncbi:hypothetical protein LJR289_001401 [Pseudoduganella sp. LjRoot289]|uniref:hypothetical protein n=1 Tax=Pseudoduganella sp. LjRoot289 TaxID=3342314 RepID=UPI003ECF065E
MLNKSILSKLVGTFSAGNAQVAPAPMRKLSAMEIAAVAGGPDHPHDPIPLALADAVPASSI